MPSSEEAPDPEIRMYVKSIIRIESDAEGKTVLPFFADGFPGLMYQETTQGLLVSPQNKMMPVFFLYGQTIHPIELSTEGPFRFIVMQLYPFAVKQLLDLNPKDYNDTCYDMITHEAYALMPVNGLLLKESLIAGKIAILSEFLARIAATKKPSPNDQVRAAIHMIIGSGGKIPVKELREALHLTERTFERQFTGIVGVSPKQFARIIQFQTSLNQLAAKDFSRLTDIVFDNGFSDQSHFIKSFKEFTGKTPSAFRKEN